MLCIWWHGISGRWSVAYCGDSAYEFADMLIRLNKSFICSSGRIRVFVTD